MSDAQILVVDDNPTNLKLISELLACEGHEVLQARDAEEARSVIERSLPDLVLMDIALPGMDGLTLTRRLKADERSKSILVVALTAFAMKGDEEKARAAGCDGYITKPIDTRKFPAQVAGFLELRRRRAPEGGGMKILVIEDHPAELKLIHHVLSAAGHSVSGADAAEKAFAAIRTDRPDVILIDMSLPGMDGLALVRKLKCDPATRAIHLVAVTTYPEKFTKQAALEAGCDAYIQKPLSSRELPGQIEAAAGAVRPSSA